MPEPTHSDIKYTPPAPIKVNGLGTESTDEKPTPPRAPKKLTKAQKTAGAVALGVGSVAGAAQVATTASNSEIDPVEQFAPSQAESAPEANIEGIEVGDRLMVLNQVVQFSTDRVRVRTSPTVEGSAKTGEPDNIADTPASVMPGSQTITMLHPIVVEDDINPANGRWLGAVDSDGKFYWVNLNALRQSGYEIDDATTSVAVTETNTNGIIAHPEDGGGEVTVGTIVSSH